MFQSRFIILVSVFVGYRWQPVTDRLNVTVNVFDYGTLKIPNVASLPI